MLPSKATWHVAESDETIVRELANAIGVDDLLARLLVVRGIRTTEQAELFLQSDVTQSHDPLLLAGMAEAVDRIRRAIADREKIRVYGDYDCDGVSSTALMVHLFRRLEANFDTYIPHRVAEGYGLNRGALDLAKEAGIGLIVTVDTGISAREEVAYAAELGIDTVVTDHHEPPEQLPDAYAVINPKRPGCPYPFKHLAGVGVAFKLAHALLGRFPEELLELATIGTIADLMPLTGENRLLVKLGLQRMPTTAYAGIKALLGVAGIDRREVSASHVAFSLAPRINASGRLDSAGDAVRLLTTASEQEAEHLAFDLDALNKERQRIVEETIAEAMQLMNGEAASGSEPPEGSPPEVIVLAKEGWNVGVIGIVASKLLETFFRPTIILGIDPETGVAKGSARSIAGFDMYRALTACSELFDHYGGHQSAAGMTLHRDRIPELRQRLQELARGWLSPEDYIPKLQVDAVCRIEDVSLDVIRQLQRLAPFGMGNPTPKFMLGGLQLGELKKMGRDQQHLKLVLNDSAGEAACSIEAVGFGRAELAPFLSPAAKVDIVGDLTVNEWNGVSRPQLMLQDIRVTQPQLFDWRGVKDEAASIRELIARLTAKRSGETANIGIVLFDREDAGRLPPAAAACSVWIAEQAHATGGESAAYAVAPFNDAAQRCRYADVRDLLVLTLPERMEQLVAALRRASGAQRVYALFSDAQPAAAGVIPTRDMFKQVYALLQKPATDVSSEWLAGIGKRLGLSAAMIRFIIAVFEELQFIERTSGGYRCAASPAKRELSSSRLYQRRLHRQQVEQALVYSTAQELSALLLPHIGQSGQVAEAITNLEGVG